MPIERSVAQTPRSTKVARDISAMRAPCVGCPGCRGLCQALIEAITVPDLILNSRTRATQ